MVGLVRIDGRSFLFETKGYYCWNSINGWVFVRVDDYSKKHDECLSRLVGW